MRATSKLVAPLIALLAGSSQAAPTFADWTTFSTVTDIAQGMLGTVGVTLSGTELRSASTNGTSTLFSTSQFTPALPTSDYIGIATVVPTTGSFQITFTQAVANPLLHLASLASVLTFSGISPELISGDADFEVSGNTVSGKIGAFDSNGTVRLPGTFTSISFAVEFVGFAPGASDEIAIQIGAEPSTPALPEPSSLALLIAAAVGLVAARESVRRR